MQPVAATTDFADRIGILGQRDTRRHVPSVVVTNNIKAGERFGRRAWNERCRRALTLPAQSRGQRYLVTSLACRSDLRVLLIVDAFTALSACQLQHGSQFG